MIRGKLSASTLVVLCALINKFYFDKAVTLPLLYPGTDTLPPLHPCFSKLQTVYYNI